MENEDSVYVNMDLDDDELYTKLPEPKRVDRIYRYGCGLFTIGVCAYMIYRFR